MFKSGGLMKVSVVGSRNILTVDLHKYLPSNTSEIISGGSVGVDACAKNYAQNNRIKFTQLLPNFELYGRSAPLKRNDLLVDSADKVIAFWDGKSRGTKHVIDYAKKRGADLTVYMPSGETAVHSGGRFKKLGQNEL